MNSTTAEDFRKHLPDGETTAKKLAETLLIVVTNNNPIPGFDPDKDDVQYYRLQQGIDCDEVYPGLYIGDSATAKNKEYLKMLGITHLLNTAEGKRFGFVNTDEHYYKDTDIKYLGLPVPDVITADISQYFYTAADFIDEGISSGGKVFVHCMLGISRSSTCALAYLMIKKRMLATNAIQVVRQNRFVRPNDGFLQQLATLDNHLRRERL